VKFWEVIADNLSKAGWSWGCVSAIDSNGRTIWIVDAHRDDGKRFVGRAEEKLTAFIELESAIRIGSRSGFCRLHARVQRLTHGQCRHPRENWPGPFKYDADTHKANPYVNGANETERGKFEKEHPDMVERCKAEAVPVGFPTGKDFNLTAQGRIARTPKLAALFDGMRRHERQSISEARAKAKADIEAAQKNLKDLEAATIP
jgi:hypothetical protein